MKVSKTRSIQLTMHDLCKAIRHVIMSSDIRWLYTILGLDSIISAHFMRNHLKTWQIGIEIHNYPIE